MKIRLILVTVIATAMSFTGLQNLQADTTNFVINLGGNGFLSWTNPPDAAGCKIYWAPTVNGPWSANWDAFKYMAATGAVMQVPVPMFYQVAAITDTNTLLVHSDGVNGSTTITDESGHAIARYGDASISTAQSKFGGSSIHFDGVGDYLSLPANSDWAFGTNDFTVDFWVYYTVAPGTANIIGQHTSGVFTDWCVIHNQGTLVFYINSDVAASYSWSPALNTWHHLAVTRAAGTVRLFINGSLMNSNLNASSIGSGRALTIGAAENPTYFLTGYLDEIRIKNGKAAWTSNFTPPGSPYAQ